jgi:hypothetical protein
MCGSIVTGPVATILAAIVAVLVTGYFAWRQSETALDQLRVALFEKRYAIYDEVKKLLRTMLNDINKPDFGSFTIVQHFIVLDEAMFFFSSETCRWIKSVMDDCEALLIADAARRAGGDSTEYASLQQKLLKHFEALPDRFRGELGFRQLTR